MFGSLSVFVVNINIKVFQDARLKTQDTRLILDADAADFAVVSLPLRNYESQASSWLLIADIISATS